MCTNFLTMPLRKIWDYMKLYETESLHFGRLIIYLQVCWCRNHEWKIWQTGFQSHTSSTSLMISGMLLGF